MSVCVEGISYWFESGTDRQFVLRELDFRPEIGKVSLIIGPSGSGKSTLLSVLGLLLRPKQGYVLWQGTRLSFDSKSRALEELRLKKIGFVFQNASLLPACTAEENVMFPATLAGSSMGEARERANTLLEHFGLAEKHKHRPAQLSLGEGQRTAICRALINDPDVILADEPTASLDAANGLVVADRLAELARQRQKTVVIVTHDYRLERIADSVFKLEDGVII